MSNFSDFFIDTYPIVITAIGALGNLTAFVIFSRKRFKKMNINFSFRAMAILNTLMLGQYCLYVNMYSTTLSVENIILCKSLQFSTALSLITKCLHRVSFGRIPAWVYGS